MRASPYPRRLVLQQLVTIIAPSTSCASVPIFRPTATRAPVCDLRKVMVSRGSGFLICKMGR